MILFLRLAKPRLAAECADLAATITALKTQQTKGFVGAG
jgi:hypothetical protein